VRIQRQVCAKPTPPNHGGAGPTSPTAIEGFKTVLVGTALPAGWLVLQRVLPNIVKHCWVLFSAESSFMAKLQKVVTRSDQAKQKAFAQLRSFTKVLYHNCGFHNSKNTGFGPREWRGRRNFQPHNMRDDGKSESMVNWLWLRAIEGGRNGFGTV